MTRVPPIVFPALALLGLIVAVLGLALGWSEVAPVAFFVLIFCAILTTMQRSILTMEPYQAPVVAAAPVAPAPVDAEPADTTPVADAPVDVEPVADEPADAQPVAAAPVAAEAVDVEHADAEPADTEAVDTAPSADVTPATDEGGAHVYDASDEPARPHDAA